MLPIKFQDNQPFVSGEETNNRFSRSRPSWLSNRISFSYFYLQVTPMLPTKFDVNWPFSSGEEAKNKFQRWQPWWPSWISDQNQNRNVYW